MQQPDEPTMHPDAWPWYHPEEIEVAPGVRWIFRVRNGELLCIPENDPEAELPIVVGSLVNWPRACAYMLVESKRGREARIELEAPGFVAYEPPIQTRVPLPGAMSFQEAFESYLRLRFAPRYLAKTAV